MQLAIKTKSLLPEGFAHILATPSSSEVEQLFWRYQGEEKCLREADDFLSSGRYTGSIGLLLQSSVSDPRNASTGSLSSRSLERAIKLLQKYYWGKAIDITDILEHMPQKRRTEWRESLEQLAFPEFTLENVYDTLSTLLSERDLFFSEYVDGIFQALSSEHITNSPSGFRKKFIIANVHEDGYPNSDKCGYISDLRRVIAKFMKRDINERQGRADTYDLVKLLYKRHVGEWVDIDGGSIRIKTYLKGTIHIEINPELSWQLNEVLALLHPRAIPSEFRVKRAKKAKAFHLSQNLLGFDVINGLSAFSQAYKPDENRYRGRYELIQNTYHIKGSYGFDKHLMQKIHNVIRAIGGVEVKSGYFEFDYDPRPVVEQIIISGSIPDKASHQFYPTPASVSDRMVSKLGALPGSQILEPSAGVGNLADKLEGDITCVEISELHCRILKDKGYTVDQADFVEWSKEAYAAKSEYDGIVMNPPFSLGRAELHVLAAMKLLSKGGTLVALLPLSVATKINTEYNHRFEVEQLEPGEFKGVSIELAIITVNLSHLHSAQSAAEDVVSQSGFIF